MNILYKFASGLNAIILTLSLLLFGVLLAVTGSFGSSQPTKEAVAESGIYQTFIGEVVDDAGGSIEVILEFKPEVRDVIIESALPHVQQDMEEGVDSVFAWLKDDSQPVTFNIDAAAARDDVSTAVGNYVVEMINALPECTVIAPGFNVNNPFLWECQPANVNVETYRTAFTGIVADEEFWNETSFTLDDIAGVTEEELTEDYQIAANAYSASQTSTWLLGGIVVLSMVATWLLAPSIPSTLRRIGISFAVVGVALVGMALGGAAVMDSFLADFSSNDVLEVASASMIEGIGTHILGWWRWSGIIGGVLGLVMVVSSLFIKGRFSAPVPDDPDLGGVPEN